MHGVALPDAAHLAVFTAEERPELWEHAEACFPVVWPEYNLHGDVSSHYFSAVYPQHAHVQVLVYDTDLGRVVARGKAIPFRWDGTLEDLPAGIDAVGLRALNEPAAPTALSALAAEVAPDQRERGLSAVVLRATTFLPAIQLYEGAGWTCAGSVTVEISREGPLEERVYLGPEPRDLGAVR